ncbi:Uncharacterized protein CGCA056_v008677 [Colletotrichum aenigma]|uniref:Uncharacterized protein n=1 Tax=Colletotrichum aenigma TaxID=1215731 RepID=UPI0018728C4D|nr:Uncharacterized protein CGCA056_v008677 [Colletotrichum aenigma]KAF5520267.1 Uncharacterized protein CGCA056_v008677 [Colletotrichum aenigma]
MSFPSDQSQASMDTALSSLQSSPTQPEFPRGRVPGKKKSNKRNLLLFFDGTGNEFSGTEKDTNVVKLLSMLDRNHEDQFHYYQTGIGTYQVNERSVHKGPAGKLWEKFYSSVDQGVGLTFDAHIMAGYRFLMRYYETGDDIYMFGFSRGAYTAKFLARMVNTVGLLCRGNEEMVPFAYRLYDRHLDGEFLCKDNKKTKKKKELEKRKSNGAVVEHNPGHDSNDQCHSKEEKQEAQDEEQRVKRNHVLRKFSNSFCRKEENRDTDRKKQKLVNVKVHFLGLWDCVNSVSVMEQKATKNVKVKGTADIIRHAVAVDERRVKFKAALFQQDKDKLKKHAHEDIKEVWFPGNHCDVGGGYHPVDDLPQKTGVFTWMWNKMFGEQKKPAKLTGPDCYVCDDCGLCKDKHCHLCNEHQGCVFKECSLCKEDLICRDSTHTNKKQITFEPCQLSDIPLAWMLRELELKAPNIHWQTEQVSEFKHRLEHNKPTAISGAVHDTLKFGYGTSNPLMVMFWNFLERFPLITRWERYHTGVDKNGKNTYEWKWVRLPLNKGCTRDIPDDATLHHTLFDKLVNDPDYIPKNQHAGGMEQCLIKPYADKSNADKLYVKDIADHPDHCTYQFMNADKTNGKGHPHQHEVELLGA